MTRQSPPTPYRRWAKLVRRGDIAQMQREQLEAIKAGRYKPIDWYRWATQMFRRKP